jgi:hypothetical protein
MTGRAAARRVSLALVSALAVGCTNYYEIPIETPIQPKLDVSQFTRVFVAGFIAGGSEEVDANLETVRLLRSQLRTKSSLRVIDAGVLNLMSVVEPPVEPAAAEGPGTNGATPEQEPPVDDALRIRNEKDLEAYEQIFADADYWKRVGEEFQNPLIVTGTVLFTPHSSAGFVQREQEIYDSFGRRRIVPVRTYMERKGFILRPQFIFIDGRTGTELYKESFREEVLYNAQQNTPALSSYFELMDRLIPSFLSTLSSQKIKGSRLLIK